MVMSFSATFCSCSVRAMSNYPASLILAFYASTIGTHRTFLSKWLRTTRSDIGYRFKDGIISLANKCAQYIPKDNLHFSTTVTNLTRVNGKILVEYTKDGKDSTLKVDRVILATEVQYAWPLLKNLPKLSELRHALQRWKHEHSSIVMHTDKNGCMPNLGVWASLNEVLCPELDNGKNKTAGGGGTEAFVTCWINNCDKNYATTKVNIFQTWQPVLNKDEMFPYYKPDEKKVLLPPALVSRPIPTVETAEHLALMHKHNHQHGIHVCGSYSQLVLPLLESCTTSALKAGRAVLMSLTNDLSSKERFDNALKKLLDPNLTLLQWDDTATACCVPSEPIGVCECMLLGIVFSWVSLLLTAVQLLSGSSDGKALNWEWCPFLAPLAFLPLLICGVLSLSGCVSHFIGVLGYIATAVSLWLYVTSLILSSLNRSKRSIAENWDVVGFLLIAEICSGCCFYYSVDYLAHQVFYGGNVFLHTYVSITHSNHWIWSNRLLSITVVWAICLTIKPLQPSTGDLTGHFVDSNLWRRMLRTTGGLGPLIFVTIGFVISISASLAFFLCYLRVLSFEEPSRRIKRPYMYKRDKICTLMLVVFILVAGFGGVISLRYTEAHSTNYIAVLVLIHVAIFSPGIWWATSDFEFEPEVNETYVPALVLTILALSWITDMCAIRETLDLMEVWKADMNSCQLRTALDGVFAVIALVLSQSSMFRVAAVMFFPGTSLAFAVLYNDLSEKQVNIKGVLPNLS